jgi:hypothetical protein
MQVTCKQRFTRTSEFLKFSSVAPLMKRLLATLVIIVAPAIAGDISYEQAKTLADQDEASLTPAFTQMLLQSQGSVAGPAFEGCPPSGTVSDREQFTVVMELDAGGKVERTWLSGSSSIATCFEKAMAKATLFAPPRAPFYTSFEMSWR